MIPISRPTTIPIGREPTASRGIRVHRSITIPIDQEPAAPRVIPIPRLTISRRPLSPV